MFELVIYKQRYKYSRIAKDKLFSVITQFWTKKERLSFFNFKDLFTECAREDEKSMKVQLETSVEEKLADIDNFTDNTLAQVK